MTKTQLEKRVAYLESINDQLSTEVCYCDELMRLLGFSGGLATVKATAKEILDNGIDMDAVRDMDPEAPSEES